MSQFNEKELKNNDKIVFIHPVTKEPEVGTYRNNMVVTKNEPSINFEEITEWYKLENVFG